MGNAESGPEDAGTTSAFSATSNHPGLLMPSIPEGQREDTAAPSAPASPLNDPDWDEQENQGDFRNLYGTTDVDRKPVDRKPVPSIGFEVESPGDDNEDDDANYDNEHYYHQEEARSEEEEEEDGDEDDGDVMSLMDASAAVFHYLENDRSQDDDEEMSVSARSAAVFQFLAVESRKGNVEPMRSFLETASVVSAVLLEENNSVSEASAAVFQFLDQAKTNDDETASVISERSAAMFQKVRSTKNENTVSRSLMGGDAHSVGPSISDNSAAIFKLLDDAKSLDANSISEFSSAIFKLLDDTQYLDDQSLKNRSGAILRLLDDAASVNRGMIRSPALASPALSPKSQRTIPHRNNSPIPSTDHSLRQDCDSDSEQEHNAPVHTIREEEDASTVYSGMTGFEEMVSEELAADTGAEDDDDDEIDLVFVEHFDTAFNEFIGRHPKFLMSNPDLVHHLRITKLQKLLEFMDTYERNILTEMAELQGEKQRMEEAFQLKLRDASRKKAARQIYLNSDLAQLSHSTKSMEAKLTWSLVDSSETRSKRQYQLRQKCRAAASGAETFEQVIDLIPEGPEGQNLKTAIHAPAGTSSSSSQWSDDQGNDLRQFQVDNAFMNAEIKTLRKKLAYQQIATKKHAWVESILLQMDAPTMSKLKKKYLKKVGVSSL